MFTAAVVEDQAGLDGLTSEWWALWRRCGDAPPFMAPAWLLPWWRHFAPGRLFVVTIRRDGALVGLAPSYIEEGPLGRRILPIGISLSDNLDLLADPSCEKAVLTALADAMLSRSDSWDSWELENLPASAAALRLQAPNGLASAVQEQVACPYVPISPSAAGLADILPRAKRRHLNLARNRTARRGAVSIETCDAAGLSAGLAHLFRLHGTRWESQGEAGVLAHTAVRGFQREAAPAMHGAGLLLLDLLRIGGTVAAAQYSLRRNGRLLIYLTGFDPAFEYESPSVLLLAHTFERALAEACHEIDFLRGREAYKYEWGAMDRFTCKRTLRRA